MIRRAFEDAAKGKQVLVVAGSARKAEDLRCELVGEGAVAYPRRRMDFQAGNGDGAIFIRAARHILRGYFAGFPIDAVHVDESVPALERALVDRELRPNMRPAEVR